MDVFSGVALCSFCRLFIHLANLDGMPSLSVQGTEVDARGTVMSEGEISVSRELPIQGTISE